MRSKLFYPMAVGIMVGLILMGLKSLHFNISSPLIAAIVGGFSGGIAAWIGPKLPRTRQR